MRVVAVRRRLAPAAELQAPAAAEVPDQAAAKTPRVFRLGDAQGQHPAPQAHAGAPAEPAPRRRRVNATKRPGPVSWQLGDGARAAVSASGLAQAAPASPMAELESLRRMLDELEPTFAQIRFAQSFHVGPPSDS